MSNEYCAIADLPLMSELDNPAWGANFDWVVDDLFRREHRGLMRTSRTEVVAYTNEDVNRLKAHPRLSHLTIDAQTGLFQACSPAGGDEGAARLLRPGSFAMRAPRHPPAKQLQSRAFTPKAVSQFVHHFGDAVQTQIAEVSGRSEIDFMTDFVRPVLVGFWEKVIGLSPKEGWHAIAMAGGIQAMFQLSISDEELPEINRVSGEYMDLMPAWLERAEKSGQHVFLSELQERWSAIDEDVRPENPYTLLASGFVDAFHAVGLVLGSSVLAMLDGGVAVSEHAGDRAFATSAFFEGSRMHGAFNFIDRQATEDFEYDGVLIPRGTIVRLMWLFANRDPEVFDDPLAFRLDRSTRAKQVTFGGGFYVCAARNLVQAMCELLFVELGKASVVIEPTGPVTWLTGSALHELTAFPVRIRTT